MTKRAAIIAQEDGPSILNLITVAERNQRISVERVKPDIIPVAGSHELTTFFQTLNNFDVIYHRTGFRGPALDLLRANVDVPIINNLRKYRDINEKITQAVAASIHKIAQPKSVLSHNNDYIKIADTLGQKFVVKPNKGSKGEGVALIDSAHTLENYIATSTKNSFIYQEFIDNPDEYRVYTIAGKGVASYKKTRGDNDFRANLHVGGDIIKTETDIETELLEFGGTIARQLGVDVAAVDIFRVNGVFVFLEINCQPGWKKVQEISGCNFDALLIDYLLNVANKEAALITE